MKKTVKVFSNKEEIGYVEKKDEDKYWSSCAYNSEIGHYGMDTEKEAIEDVRQMHKENKAFELHIASQYETSLTKKKLFWMYAIVLTDLCQETCNDPMWKSELVNTLKELAKEAGVRWDNRLFQKTHWQILEMELK